MVHNRQVLVSTTFIFSSRSDTMDCTVSYISRLLHLRRYRVSSVSVLWKGQRLVFQNSMMCIILAIP